MTKEKTSEEFIKEAQKIHGNKYNYESVVFKNRYTKVIIICDKHGFFKQSPYKHLIGQNCPLCVGKNKLNNVTFMQKAKQKHGDRYDYSKVDYKNAYKKVKICCKIHGDFIQKPSLHLSGSGCPECGIITRSKKKTKTQDKDDIKKSLDAKIL